MLLKIYRIHEKLTSIAVSIFLSSQLIRAILEAYVPTLKGYGLYLVYIISGTLFLLSMRQFHFFPSSLMVPTVILIYYTITQLLYPGSPSVSTFGVINFCILPFLYAQAKIDFEKVIKYTLIFTSPGIFVSDQLFSHYGKSQAVTMEISYFVLFSVLCAISYLVYYRKNDGRIKILYTLLCVIQLYYFYEVLVFGSRGSALSVFVYVVLLFIFRQEKNQDREKKYHKTILFIVLITGFFVALFFTEILEMIYNYFRSHNIYIRSLEKTYRLMQYNDVSNGRDIFYRTALEGFFLSPIVGNGFDMFFAKTGLIYPHNIFLQLAYDGGLIMLAAVILPVVYASVKIFKSRKYSLINTWLILFSASVPAGMLSGNCWKKYVLWFFVANCLVQAKRRE